MCDYRSHALHVLSEQGDILTCKVMEDTGIKYPISLDIDMRGQLWVGCVEDEGSDAKIHDISVVDARTTLLARSLVRIWSTSEIIISKLCAMKYTEKNIHALSSGLVARLTRLVSLVQQ